jgi:N-hydroxyarylamine O-acetyltransferase
MVDLDAYFERIGYTGPREPTLEVLKDLHALHPSAIPFEAIDCLLDRPVDLSPQAINRKLIFERRGGYCFEHNGLFSRVLEALGFSVSAHAARVRWGTPAGTPPRPRTHRVNLVDIDGAKWIADVGFGGCVLTEPLLLQPDKEHQTAHDLYRLRSLEGGISLDVFRDGEWLPAWDLPLEPCVDADFEMANWWTSAHPDSHFRNTLIVSRVDRQARHALLDNRYTVRAVGGEVIRTILDAEGIEQVLREVLGLPVEADWRPFIEKAATVVVD